MMAIALMLLALMLLTPSVRTNPMTFVANLAGHESPFNSSQTTGIENAHPPTRIPGSPRVKDNDRPNGVNRSPSHQRRLSCQSRGSPRTSSRSRGNARAQALQLAVPDFDRVVVVRLDVIGDAGGDDFAFC